MELQPLEPLYYHRDFMTLVDWVRQRYPDFWFPEEQAQIDRFLALPAKAQALLIRLLNRKGLVFQVSRIDYSELRPVQDCLKSLLAAGFVDLHRTAQENAECVQKVPLRELQEWLGVRGTKAALVELAMAHPELDQWLGLDWLVLRCQALFDRFRVLFFGNIHQDMTTFVLAGMGLQTYEDYFIDPNLRRFGQRCDLENMMRWATWWSETYENPPDPAETETWYTRCLAGLEELPATWQKYPLRFLRSLGLANLNHNAEWAKRCLFRYLAVNEDWEVRARTVRWLKKRGESEAALQLLDQGERFLTPLEHNAYAKLRHQLAIGARPDLLLSPHNLCISADQSVPSARGGKRRYCQSDGEWVTIESFVLNHFEGLGWSGFFAENGWIQSVLGLWARSCIFAPVPGAFDHPFQEGPLDLGSASFFNKRETLFAKWEKQWLAAYPDDWLEYLAAAWLEHGQKRTRFYHCAPFSWSVTQSVLAAYPLESWVRLALRFFQLKRSLWRGFPDLVLLREGRVVFAEVKAEREQVSDYQKNWHHELLNLGFEVWLIRVAVKGGDATAVASPD